MRQFWIFFSLVLLAACVPASSENTLSDLTGIWEPQGFSEQMLGRLELEQTGTSLQGKAFAAGLELGEVSGEVIGTDVFFRITLANGDYYDADGSIYEIFLSGLYRLKNSKDRLISIGSFNLSWRGLKP